jgi:hypothetical protein
MAHAHPEPFEGIEGYWVHRAQFSGTKSFGWYQCDGCDKTWFSAHAFTQYRQGCQSCETQTLPCCLWVNTGSRNNNDGRPERDDGPHDSLRCEACRQGACRQCQY